MMKKGHGPQDTILYELWEVSTREVESGKPTSTSLPSADLLSTPSVQKGMFLARCTRPFIELSLTFVGLANCTLMCFGITTRIGQGEFLPLPSTTSQHKLPRDLQKHLEERYSLSSPLARSRHHLCLSRDGNALAVVYPDGCLELATVLNKGKREILGTWNCMYF